MDIYYSVLLVSWAMMTIGYIILLKQNLRLNKDIMSFLKEKEGKTAETFYAPDDPKEWSDEDWEKFDAESKKE